MKHISFAFVGVILVPAIARADAFDHYTNPVLAKASASANVEKVAKVTRAQLVATNDVLPAVSGSMLIVRTNEGRWAKVLVQPGQQKIGDDKRLPIVSIDRFATYREGEERATLAKGANVRLFADFRFSLDIGQIVPAGVEADLAFKADETGVYLAPVGKAEIYLLTKHVAEGSPKEDGKLAIGETFSPVFFNGKYKLYDDGRRSGELSLKVRENGAVEGFYYSDKDGRKYDVEGRIGNPSHAISFQIQFPRTLQFFQGMLFTGDARAISGTSRLQERQTGFYAVRIEDKK